MDVCILRESSCLPSIILLAISSGHESRLYVYAFDVRVRHCLELERRLKNWLEYGLGYGLEN